MFELEYICLLRRRGGYWQVLLFTLKKKKQHHANQCLTPWKESEGAISKWSLTCNAVTTFRMGGNATMLFVV